MAVKLPAVKKPGTAVATYEDRLAAMAKQNVEQEASVAAGGFISFRAGQLSYQGSPVKGNTLDVIVVDSVLENCYYADRFDPENPAPPSCYAFGRVEDELAPHADCSDPQAVRCCECPNNEFGTASEGKGKACKNTRRLAVIPAAPLEEEALRKSEVAYMKLPVTSVKGWATYVRGLSVLENLPPLAVVSTVSTVPDPKSQFKVVFGKASNIPRNLLPVLFARNEEISQVIMFPYAAAKEVAAPVKKQLPKKRKF